jgi:PAS domain S-box-containing protein
MGRRILIIAEQQPPAEMLAERLGLPLSDVMFAEGLDKTAQAILKFEFALIVSLIFPSPHAWYRMLSEIRHSAWNGNVPIVIDSGALQSWPDFTNPRELGVEDIIDMSKEWRRLFPYINIEYSPTAVLTRFYENPDLNKRIHETSERELSRLKEALETLKQDNSELGSRLEREMKNADQLSLDLDSSTEELEAITEELRATNEQLRQKNDQLLQASQALKERTDQIISSQQEAIRRREQSLEIIFKNTREEILVLDRNGRAVFFNEALRNFILIATGVEPIIGKEVWKITVPARREAAKELFDRTLSGENTIVEARVNTREGEVIHLLSYSPVIINDKVEFVTVISTDITSKKKQEEALKKSEANLLAIFNNTDDAFALLDADLKLVAFNENNYRHVVEITGRELVLGKSILEILPPERAEGFRSIIQKVNEGDSVRGTTHFRAGDKEKWFDISVQSVRNDKNHITGYSITAHNCTDVKLAEIEIMRLNKSLLNFQNAIHRSSIVSIADSKGDITFVNENFIKISGYSYEELVGKNHRIINSGYHPRSFWMNMWKTISGGGVWRNRVKNRAKEGSYYWVDTFIMPFKDEEGKIYQYLSIRNDITSIKNAEEELLQKQLLLQQASRISKIGYYVISRETKTISLSAELLEILGLTEGEFSLIYHDKTHPRFENIRRLFDVETLLDGEENKDEEFRFPLPDGAHKWLYRRSNFSMVINNEEKIIGTIQDTTDQKAVEEVLKEYNERFEMVSRATNDAIWDLDLQLDIIVWNHAIKSTFGYDEANMQLSREWWKSRIHPEDSERVNNGFDSAIAQGKTSWSQVFRFQCADGTYKFVNNRCYLLYDGGTPVRAIGSLQDITETMKTTEEIRKLSLVASKTNSGVMITDQNGLIDWVNESFSRLTGYSLEEIRGKSSIFLQGPETDELVVKRISEKLMLREPVSEEIINYTKEGKKYWVKLEIVPVYNENNELKNFISIQTDITELKEYENSITVIAEELATLIQNANVPIFGVDVSGNINEWNSVSSQLFGYTRDQVLGKHYKAIFQSARSSDGLDEIIHVALLNLPVSNCEVPMTTRSGAQLILLLSASPRRSKTKQTTGVIFVGQNITELTDYRVNLERKVEERTKELHVALSKEQELVKLKNQFISIASHEFRTPLSTITLAAGFIRKYKDRITTKVVDEKVSSIEKQVNNMTYLLDDILIVGKAEAGKLPVHLKPIEISSFVENLSREVERALGSSHQIVIRESLRYREIVSDEKLLRNILTNLLTNAIKFSPGSDIVEVSIKTEMDDMDLIIRDYGIGIPEEDFQNIFEPFFRGANVRSIHGTGLGLAIIKKAVDLLQGSIDVKSVHGEGTVVHVRLPI